MNTLARPDLSLVFPVFDEEDNIGQLLEQVLETAPRLALDFEIVIVDDGSRDASAEVVEAVRNGEPRIRLLRHESNRGYGAALRAGLREARGNLVFFSDADLQFDLDELSTLLHHAHEFDIVAGYRQPRRDPWGRRLLAAGWGWLVGTLFDLQVRDIDCAFKIFRRHVIEAIPIESVGAFVNTEILVRARQKNFRILQFNLDELSTLLHHAREFDIVAGYRQPRRDPWGRRSLAAGWGWLVDTLFDLQVRDIDCAFKIFRRHVIEAIPIESVGAFVNTEILVRARQENFRIHQVPVNHRRRRFGRQSGANPRVILRALLELASLYRELRQPVAVGAVQRDEG